MKTSRSFFDRMSPKTVGSMLCAHLREYYRLSPAAAEGMAGELLRHAQLLNPGRRDDGQIIYPAVAADQPTGKPLAQCRKLPVRLTLFADGDMQRQHEAGATALLQHVLVRIADEAAEQGAPLTIEDLAWLLHTSTSTIKRYRRALSNKGTSIRLRGDVTDAGPAITHRDRIVKLFLLGYSETEIAERCNHQLDCVEAYLYDFLRVGILAQEGKPVGTISRLTKLSLPKVKVVFALYDTLRQHPDYAEPVRHYLQLFSMQRSLGEKGETTR